MERRREVLPRCAFSYHCQCKKKSQIYVCSFVFSFEFTVSVINSDERLQSLYNCMIALNRGPIVDTNTHAVACFLIDVTEAKIPFQFKECGSKGQWRCVWGA